MKTIASIENPAVINAIFAHLERMSLETRYASLARYRPLYTAEPAIGPDGVSPRSSLLGTEADSLMTPV